MSAIVVDLIGDGWTLLQRYTDGVVLFERQEGPCEEAWPRVFVGADGRPGPVRTLRCMIEETRLAQIGHRPRWQRAYLEQETRA